MSQHHITIQEESQLPPVHRCSQCCMLYHCPLCSPHVYKPAHRYKVLRHLRCHLTRAVHFKRFSIYKCNLGCRPLAHFHCFCEKLFLNRSQFVHHLNRKHGSDLSDGPGVTVQDCNDDAAEQPQPPSPSPGGQPAADLSRSCAAISDTLSSCEGVYAAAAWSSDTPSNMVAPPATDRPAVSHEPASAPSDEPCQSKTGPNKLPVCSHCSVVMSKSCLNIHMETKDKRNIDAVCRPDCHHSPTPVQLEILTQLRDLQQQQNQMLQLLLKLTNTDSRNDPAEADLRALFPITDEEGLVNLELKLSETPGLKNQLICFFGDTDGRPIDQTVQRILERMLSNTFAQRMDWRGKNNKVSFASSCLKDIVNDAVRRNSVCARAADEAVESAVKKWLQQAGERDEARRREEVVGVEHVAVN